MRLIAQEQFAGEVRSISGVLKETTGLARGEREYLPPKRTGGMTAKAKIDGFDIFLTANPFPDGRLAEFFMNLPGTQASVLREMANLVSIFGSLALQYGAPAEKIIEAMRNRRFEPAGKVEIDEDIKMASSIADYVGRRLGADFLGMKELLDVRSHEPITEDEVSQFKERVIALDRRALAIAEGYSGDICPNPACNGIHMVRQGSCVRCNDCGENTGCG
jgi:ribonucleoside-diphosphate reductase alpha chain